MSKRHFLSIGILVSLLGSCVSPVVKINLDRIRIIDHFSADLQNATQVIQDAIDSNASTVIIPFAGQPWIVEPIRLRSGLKLIMEPGVILEAKRGSFQDPSDSMFLAQEVHDISIIGHNATIRMHKKDYQSSSYKKAEWRHGITLKGASDISIRGLRIENTGGDGIYVGPTWDDNRISCSNIHIADCVLDRNHRQGISIVSATNVLVENCLISETSGTAPQAGIDLEPSHYRDPLTNITIRNCQVLNNNGSGFLVNISRHSNKSLPISATIQQCYVRNTIQPGLRIIQHKDIGATGYIKFVDCVISGTQYAGSKIIWDTSSSVALSFQNCKWVDVGKRQGQSPLELNLVTGPDKKSRSYMKFNNIEIFDSFQRDAVIVNPINPVFNIKGDIKVIGIQSINMGLKALPNLKIVSKIRKKGS